MQKSKIHTYPLPKYSDMLAAYSEINDCSKSEAGAIAIKQFFDSMTPIERQKIVSYAKKNLSKNSY